MGLFVAGFTGTTAGQAPSTRRLEMNNKTMDRFDLQLLIPRRGRWEYADLTVVVGHDSNAAIYP